MPIVFECPECEKSLKIKDELRGKKIRCPGCESIVLVEEADDDEDSTPEPVASRPTRRTRDDDDDDDDDQQDDRPRKKRKKAKPAPVNYAPWFIGGGVLLVAVVLFFLVRSFTGSEKEMAALKSGVPGKMSKGGFDDDEPVIPPDQLKALKIWNTHLVGSQLRFQFRRNGNQSVPSRLQVVFVSEPGERISFDIEMSLQSQVGEVMGGAGTKSNSVSQMTVDLGNILEIGGRGREPSAPRLANLKPNTQVYLAERRGDSEVVLSNATNLKIR